MRQPYNTLIIPFRIIENKIEYLLAKRSDMDIWQAFSGGGEGNETIIETAKRELKEETNLESHCWIKIRRSMFDTKDIV
jgi:dATP pyrophosphohydrolase